MVSNHGGRSLDFTPGSAEVPPEIVSAVRGKTRILLDGGIRSGEDVLKAVAFGAEAVLVSRPVAIAAIGGESQGVAFLFRQYHRELITGMLLTGYTDLSGRNPGVIRRIN